MVQVSIIKYLNAVREQFQSCWLLMFSASSHTKPQNHSGAQEEHLGQAADVKLQEQFPKSSGRQTDRHPEEQGLAASQSSQAGIFSWGIICSELHQLTQRLQQTVNPSSLWGTDLAGSEWGSSYPRPGVSFWGTASLAVQQFADGTIATGSLCRLSLWSGREAGMSLEACWHTAFFHFFRRVWEKPSSAGYLPRGVGKTGWPFCDSRNHFLPQMFTPLAKRTKNLWLN